MDADQTLKGKNHNKALHVSIECRGTTLARVLVDTGSSLNVLPKGALYRLDCEGVVLKPNPFLLTITLCYRSCFVSDDFSLLVQFVSKHHFVPMTLNPFGLGTRSHTSFLVN